MKPNFILEVIADNWDRPDVFGNKFQEDQSITYRFLKDINGKTAEDHGYSTSHVYADWVLAKFPNAPNGTNKEAADLVATRGVSGAAWFQVQV